MDCSICLGRIKKNQVQFQLSCDHVFHYKCFLLYIYNTGGNIFVNCPLCREMNYAIDKPFDSPRENLKFLCSDGVGKVRCHHRTKKGNYCKNPSHILNYGYCNLHNKQLLPKDKYPLMCDFIFYLLQASNLWRTKLYMIDIAKKLIIQEPNINTIQDIQYYFFRYFNYYKNKNEVCETMLLPTEIYKYYDLELPPTEWVTYCNEKKKII